MPSILNVYVNTAYVIEPWGTIGSTPTGPSITSFNPTSAAVGETVTVTGTGFTGATGLTLNGAVIAIFTVASAASITFTVPAGSTTGAITVTTPGGSATSPTNLAIAPTITSFAPTSGPAGSNVVLTGTGFTGASLVSLNSAAVDSFTVDSATQITVKLTGANTTGKFKVTHPQNGTGTSSANFTVTAATPGTVTTSFSQAQIKDGLAFNCDMGGLNSGYLHLMLALNGATGYELDIETQNSTTYEPWVHQWVDGQIKPPIQCTPGVSGTGAGGYMSKVVTVPGSFAAGAQTVKLQTGPSIFGDLTYRAFDIVGIRLFNGNAAASIQRIPRKRKVWLYMHDSILCQQDPTDTTLSLAYMLRTGRPDTEMIFTGASGQWLMKRFDTQAKRKAYAAQMAAYFPADADLDEGIIINEDCHNAWGNSGLPADFGACMEDIYDEIRRLRPKIRIMSHEAFGATNEQADFGYGPLSVYSDIKQQVAAVRPDYVTHFTGAHNLFANNRRPGDSVHESVPDGIRIVADFYLTKIPQYYTPTVGTAVYTPPAVADTVLWKMDLRTNLLDTGPNAFPFTMVGNVTIDANKNAAYFDGASYLTRKVSQRDNVQYGYKITGKLWVGVANNGDLGVLQAGGAYGVSVHQTSAGQGEVGFEAQRDTDTTKASSYVLLKTPTVAIAGAWVPFEIVWAKNQSKVKYTAAGLPPQVSARLDKVILPSNADHNVGSGPGGNFVGWLQDLQCVALGSNANVPEASTEGNTTPGGNTGNGSATITSMSVTQGKENDAVTVKGTGLDGIKAVTFYGNISAAIQQNNASQIVFLVPGNVDTAAAHPITFTLSDNSLLDTPSFQVNATPASPEFTSDSGFDSTNVWDNRDPNCTIGNGKARFVNAVSGFSAGKTLRQQLSGMAGSTRCDITVTITAVTTASTFIVLFDNGNADGGTYTQNVAVGTYTFTSVISQNTLVEFVGTGTFDVDTVKIAQTAN